MIIKQNSRIQHKTNDIDSAAWTIPPQEDPTLGFLVTDLMKSEIAVNEFTNKVFIRIGSTIHEFDLDGSGGGPSNTDALAEGTTNLYYTDARARLSLSAGSGISYNSGTGVISATAGATDTDGLPEGSTNLYYTDARSRLALSAGTGIIYDDTTGIISLAGFSDEYKGQWTNEILVPTITPATTFYDVDCTLFTLIRLETFATCYDVPLDKYYSWQHVCILRNSGGTVTVEREYYTKEDKDGNVSNTDVVIDITGPFASVGLKSTEVGLMTDAFSMTKVIVLS